VCDDAAVVAFNQPVQKWHILMPNTDPKAFWTG